MHNDTPKSLASPDARATRLAAIEQSHIAPLTRFVEALREQMGDEYRIPYFDPFDGGTKAECLFLLEAPGPKAVTSSFVSRNNPDETAKNFFCLNRDAGIERKRTIIWNIVPWYIGSGIKIRPATARDLGTAGPSLSCLLSLLPALRSIVLVGNKASSARAAICELAPAIKIYSMPHPSPMFVNRSPGNRQLILEQLQAISRDFSSHTNAN